MIESPIFAIFIFLLFPVFSSLFALHKGIYESWDRTVLFLLFFALLSWLIMETAVLFQEKYWGIKAAEAEIFLSWGWLFIFFPILMFSFLFMVVLAAEKHSCGKSKIIAGVYFKSDLLFASLGGSSPFGYVEFKEDWTETAKKTPVSAIFPEQQLISSPLCRLSKSKIHLILYRWRNDFSRPAI